MSSFSKITLIWSPPQRDGSHSQAYPRLTMSGARMYEASWCALFTTTGIPSRVMHSQIVWFLRGLVSLALTCH